MVTINYRLGLLGYFAHPAITANAAADEAFVVGARLKPSRYVCQV